MEIRELASRTGTTSKTIRYYESISLLPKAKRKANGYRDYEESDVDRLKFVLGARRLDFSLDDIREILDMRDRREAPCRTVLNLMAKKEDEITHRIAELQVLKNELGQLHTLGLTFPTNDIEGKNCVCHLVKEQSET
jgi:DNA-binding transcriptional MerR regulator